MISVFQWQVVKLFAIYQNRLMCSISMLAKSIGKKFGQIVYFPPGIYQACPMCAQKVKTKEVGNFILYHVWHGYILPKFPWQLVSGGDQGGSSSQRDQPGHLNNRGWLPEEDLSTSASSGPSQGLSWSLRRGVFPCCIGTPWCSQGTRCLLRRCTPCSWPTPE